MQAIHFNIIFGFKYISFCFLILQNKCAKKLDKLMTAN